MSSALRKPVRRFLIRLPLALLAAMIVWLVLRPSLESGVGEMAERLVRFAEEIPATYVMVTDGEATIDRFDPSGRQDQFHTATVDFTFNTILLLALFWSSPRPLEGSHLARLALAWLILFLVQSLNFASHVGVFYASGAAGPSAMPDSGLAREAVRWLKVVTDLPLRFGLPFLLWAFFARDRLAELLDLAPEPVPARTSQRKGKARRKR